MNISKNENNILKYCKIPIIKISWKVFFGRSNTIITLFVVYMYEFSLYFSIRDFCSGIFCFRLYRVTRKLWEFHEGNFTLNKGVDRKKCSRGQICPKRKKFVLPPLGGAPRGGGKIWTVNTKHLASWIL